MRGLADSGWPQSVEWWWRCGLIGRPMPDLESSGWTGATAVPPSTNKQDFSCFFFVGKRNERQSRQIYDVMTTGKAASSAQAAVRVEEAALKGKKTCKALSSRNEAPVSRRTYWNTHSLPTRLIQKFAPSWCLWSSSSGTENHPHETSVHDLLRRLCFKLPASLKAPTYTSTTTKEFPRLSRALKTWARTVKTRFKRAGRGSTKGSESTFTLKFVRNVFGEQSENQQWDPIRVHLHGSNVVWCVEIISVYSKDTWCRNASSNVRKVEQTSARHDRKHICTRS